MPPINGKNAIAQLCPFRTIPYPSECVRCPFQHSMLLPMHFAASAARAMSPITAVIVVASSMGDVSPFDVVKRTAIPMVGALITIVVANFVLFY